MTESKDNSTTILVQSDPKGLAREQHLTNVTNAAASSSLNHLKWQDWCELLTPGNSSTQCKSPDGKQDCISNKNVIAAKISSKKRPITTFVTEGSNEKAPCLKSIESKNRTDIPISGQPNYISGSIVPQNETVFCHVPTQPRPVVSKNKLSPPTTAPVKPISSSAADQSKKILSAQTKPKKSLKAKPKKRKTSKKQRKLLAWAKRAEINANKRSCLATPMMITRSRKESMESHPAAHCFSKGSSNNEGQYDLWLRPALKDCCVTLRDANHIKNILEGTILHGRQRFSPRIISVAFCESCIRIKSENYDTHLWLAQNVKKIPGPWMGHSGYVVTTEPTVPIIKCRILKSLHSVLPASSDSVEFLNLMKKASKMVDINKLLEVQTDSAGLKNQQCKVEELSLELNTK